MGIGDGLIPKNLNQSIYEDIYVVSDEEAIQTAKFKELTFKRTIPKRRVGFAYREDVSMSDTLKKFMR